MPNTYTDYSATANQQSFSYSFPVLLAEHVAVEINTKFVFAGTKKEYANLGSTKSQSISKVLLKYAPSVM